MNHQVRVVTSYLLASTIATAVVGKLGDLFGRKAVFEASILFFFVGSVLWNGVLDDDAVPRARQASAAARSWSPRWRSG